MLETQARERVIERLIELSQWLGEESRGLAIFGEGNTSARISDNAFLIKASGRDLGSISGDGFVEMNARKVLRVMEDHALSDEAIKAGLSDAMVRPGADAPSVETVFHAYLLSLPGVNFVGHTHPISINSILCSKGWQEVLRGRMTPEEVASCGIAPALVEYTDPGVQLAISIREAVADYMSRYGVRPKAILMQNHGLIALGSTPGEVKKVTAMWDKTAKIMAGTLLYGGPNYLSEKDAMHIFTRPDLEARDRVTIGGSEGDLSTV